MRTALHLSEASSERLRSHPQEVFPLEEGVAPDFALGAAADGLARLGLKVRLAGGSADGRSGVVGMLGSPLFHWALVALMVVVAAGQATRSEGFMALPLDVAVAETHLNYLKVNEGPLFRENHTGLELQATKVDRNYKKGGVDYGPTPLVTVSRDSVEIASGLVHSNSPLRVGPLMIHMAALGPSATLALESPGGPESGRVTFTLDRSDTTSSGTKPQMFTLPGASGAPGLSARIQVLVQRVPSAESTSVVSRVILEIAKDGSEVLGPPVVIAEGDAIDLPDGRRLRVAKVSDWVRVSVANDWSVPFIYGLLITAILGLALALLVPMRKASVLLVEDGAGYALHVGTWHARRNPLFKRQVLDAVRIAAGETEKQ